jgi:ABC-type polysaccharide/polyol phosphate transport system ATPase subunit
MSPEGTIRAEQLWKRFRADPRRHGREPNWRDLILHSRSWSPRGHYRWALRDLSFVVDPGEAVGVIGVNGSGKSTLLKILTGTMDPTAGRLDVEGRVGALIELQAGLHPELSGRENAIAYGSLLGLSRKRVRAGLDEVIEFAGVGGAVDRLVKFYSTGMKLRLGFAIAAHLEAPVLLVDEVLAVADADFQRRALDRLAVLRDAGATVVLVSHDLEVIEALCPRVVQLEEGKVVGDGPAGSVLAAYREASA